MDHIFAFEILGIAPTIDRDEIKETYHTLALRYHPDKCADLSTRASTERMKALNAAYEFLKQRRYRSPKPVKAKSDPEQYYDDGGDDDDDDDDDDVDIPFPPPPTGRPADASTDWRSGCLSDITATGLCISLVNPGAARPLYRVQRRGTTGVVIYTKASRSSAKTGRHSDGGSRARWPG